MSEHAEAADDPTGPPPSIEMALDELDRILGDARAMPLSASVMVNRAEVVGLLVDIRHNLPDELAQARWVVRERDEILERARVDAGQVLGEARAEREGLLSQEDVVRAAHAEAERIVDAAHETARQMRLEAEDYVDAKLANFEVVLHKTLSAVERGRERLRGRLEIDALSDVDLAEEDSNGFDSGGVSGGGRV
jgi:cell division septum initiation protein DivIVA